MIELDAIISRLIGAGVECVLIGGYAAITHGVSYVTQDVDVCAPLDFENLQRIWKALEGTHPRHRDHPKEIPFELERHSGGLNNLYLMTDLGPVDFLGLIPGIGDYAFARAHSVTARLPFGNIQVLDRATLIRAKMHAGRPRDQLVVGQLRAIDEALSKNKPES